jgi:phage terminase large subunit-like protein
VGLSLLERAVRKSGVEAIFTSLSPVELAALKAEWQWWARPEQLEPAGNWSTWLILAGRAFGKSRTGAETVRRWAMEYPGCHIALVGRTAADVRDVMVRALLTPWRGGEFPHGDPRVPKHEPSKRMLWWPNGSYATTYSAEVPDQLRGPQHDFAWCDELAAWPHSAAADRELGARTVAEEMWYEALLPGMRGSGFCSVPVERPRKIVTTTPRPRRLVRDILAEPDTFTTRGSTFDNASNLPREYVEQMRRKYEGTRIGRQELYAEILDDVPGALWTFGTIDDHRVTTAPDLFRVVVGVDPSGSSKDGTDEQGIVAAGIDRRGEGYVLEDATCHEKPDGWGKAVVRCYQRHRADAVVVERNFGGDMARFVVEQAARDLKTHVNVVEVSASRGKVARAEPVSALYEQGRIHHVGDDLRDLEEQLRGYVPSEGGKSPDRLDALVWAFTELMLDGDPTMYVESVRAASARSR